MKPSTGNDQQLLRTSRSDRRAATLLEPLQVLYWIYAARLVISLAVFGSAIFWGDLLERDFPGSLSPEFPLIAVTGLAAAAFLTPIAYRYSHRKGREIGLGFLYSQAALDVLLVNGVVHITGGSGSPFVSLFIALAAGYALVLPLSSAVLTALSAGVLYLFLNLTLDPATNAVTLSLQVAVIMLVAVAASLVGARFRRSAPSSAPSKESSIAFVSIPPTSSGTSLRASSLWMDRGTWST